MLNYVLKQATRTDKFNGKWYGKLVLDETIDLAGLAQHMASHNNYSRASTVVICTKYCSNLLHVPQ